VRKILERYHELLLAATVLVMVGYEAAEIWVLEDHQARPLLLALVIHVLQVVAVLTATTLAVRAWRRRAAHEQALTRLVERVVVAQEDERRRIAYELHDSISPLVVSAKQHLDTSRDLLRRDPGRAEAQLTTGIERLGRAIVETRRVLAALRPAALASEGLDRAARRSIEETAGEAGWEVTFTAQLGEEPLPATVEAAAYRILQEALTNARKHAHTTRVDVALRCEDGWLQLDVRDHGVGLAAEDGQGRGLGLTSMNERARLLGGTCAVEPAEQQGTRVRVRLPLRLGAET
jgi:signal transduction histidine kinase